MNSIPEKKSISALIVNHNGGQAVLTCLEALKNQSKPLEEIVVVDNASNDGSPEQIALKFPEVKIIWLHNNLGLSRAHNIGLHEITSDLVVIIDDDVYVDTQCVHRLYEAYIKYSAAIVCPRVLLYPDSQIVQCDGAIPHFVGTLKLRHAYQPFEILPTDAVEIYGCIGACRLVDRKVILECGGFDDEYFLYFEDLEFSLRIRAFGYKIICEPKAIVYHNRGLGTPQLSFRGQGNYPSLRFHINIRQRLMTILIHYKIKTILVLFPSLFLYEIMSIFVAIQRGWIKTYLSAIISVGSAHSHIASRRQYLLQNRKLSDRELIAGGELPMAIGFLRTNREEKLVAVFSKMLNIYWEFAKNLIG
jgi:GT2 family glycosyltransferase